METSDQRRQFLPAIYASLVLGRDPVVLANRTAVALAGELGTPVAEFPGDHVGLTAFPEQFGRALDQGAELNGLSRQIAFMCWPDV